MLPLFGKETVVAVAVVVDAVRLSVVATWHADEDSRRLLL